MAYLLPQLLNEAAASDPGHEAVRAGGRSLTYGELDTASNAVANALIDAGVRRGDRVAIHLAKGVESLAGIYGVLKAGAAYVPIDPRAPVPRAAFVANDCSVSAVITTADVADRLVPELATRPRLVVTVGGASGGEVEATSYDDVVANAPAVAPEVTAIDGDLAYILYTSGSTGTPKGVMLSHRNAMSFVGWSAETIGGDRDDRFANHAPLHFDLSIFDLYVAALFGATVVMVPEQDAYIGASIADFIRDEGITTWYSVPSALRLLTKVGAEDPFPTLRRVVFAGEVYPTPQLRQLRDLLPEVDLWNLYGPTETNVCTYYRVDDVPTDDRTIPIGRACANTEVFAIRTDGEVAEAGDEGELYVRGPTVMKGYWGNAEMTDRVLVPDPRPGGVHDLVYRTGDIVRVRPDGDLDFVGRRDHQIKSRGYRIELGEIEAALASHPEIEESAVAAVPHEEWGSAILAWVAPSPRASIGVLEVKRHVASRLPRYMVPAEVTILETLPKTSTGKVDRPALIAARAANGGGGS
jgi:amino acid adenylation domain-containing protein